MRPAFLRDPATYSSRHAPSTGWTPLARARHDPRVHAYHARLLALSMLALGFTIRDMAELLRAHPEAVAALLA